MINDHVSCSIWSLHKWLVMVVYPELPLIFCQNQEWVGIFCCWKIAILWKNIAIFQRNFLDWKWRSPKKLPLLMPKNLQQNFFGFVLKIHPFLKRQPSLTIMIAYYYNRVAQAEKIVWGWSFIFYIKWYFYCGLQSCWNVIIFETSLVLFKNRAK